MGPRTEASILCLGDFETAAQDALPHAVYEFVAAGAGDEITLADNKAAFDRIKLRPRVLRDVSTIDTQTELFGVKLPHPLLLAPTGLQRLSHPEGEVATASGAGKAGAIFVLSTNATATIEECVAASSVPIWFLLYWQSDREFNRDLVARVEAGGAKALMITVDSPTLGERYRQERAGFKIPTDLVTPYFHDRNSGLPRRGSRQDGRPAWRENLSWREIEWLRSLTKMPLILKGILDPADAEQAVEIGANGLVVSNHGARNLDTLPATIDALPAVAERVSGRATIILDGGIRRGTDVLKSLALGATAVMLGRPYVFALAAAGAAGVTRCVNLLRDELETAMALTGRRVVAEIDRSVIW
jgi:4-hydroxymandelate oxidase